jgi:tRNA (cmo5U34)-methyltransferase
MRLLEKMGEFFDKRLDEYEDHQLNCIDSAHEFYTYTAKNLPMHKGCRIIDLGCGTGLELDEYFRLNPSAEVLGIDLAPGMLNRLQEKYCGKELILIPGSYFDVPFGTEKFDASVSVESLHHFTADEKIPLYEKLQKSLKTNGYFILTDYFSLSDEEEAFHRKELLRLKSEQSIEDNEFYHYDTPLTVDHEIECLISAGFSSVEILNHWGATYTIKAIR